MEDLTDDQIIELGDFCEQMHRSVSFTLLLKTFELQIVSHMMSTEPHETKKREGIFASCLGVRDFQAHMAAFIDQKRKLTEPEEKELSETDALPDDLTD